MKYLLFSACFLFSLFAVADLRLNLFNTQDRVKLEEEIDKIPGLDKTNKSKLFDAVWSYKEASKRLNEVMDLNGLRKNNRKKWQDGKPVVNADVVDPTIRKIQQQARKYHNRFEALNKTVKKWGPSTNLLARAARQSMQSRLDDERDVSKWTRKIWKAKLQAEKKDQKNYESWVKDTKKARDKSSTELAEFFQAILDQAAAAREE